MNKRLTKEFNRLSDEYDIEVSEATNSLNATVTRTTWQLALFGPDDSPYFGGTYLLKIVVPDEYPFRPPVVTFETKIYHPNINHKGEICLEILSDGWKASKSMIDAIREISKLLSKPNPDDPMAIEVAKVFLKDRALFDKNAKEWTERYAM
jgi:ubiquitin-conjugating enzyme E2 D/E